MCVFFIVSLFVKDYLIVQIAPNTMPVIVLFHGLLVMGQVLPLQPMK